MESLYIVVYFFLMSPALSYMCCEAAGVQPWSVWQFNLRGGRGHVLIHLQQENRSLLYCVCDFSVTTLFNIRPVCVFADVSSFAVHLFSLAIFMRRGSKSIYLYILITTHSLQFNVCLCWVGGFLISHRTLWLPKIKSKKSWLHNKSHNKNVQRQRTFCWIIEMEYEASQV